MLSNMKLNALYSSYNISLKLIHRDRNAISILVNKKRNSLKADNNKL